MLPIEFSVYSESGVAQLHHVGLPLKTHLEDARGKQSTIFAPEHRSTIVFLDGVGGILVSSKNFGHSSIAGDEAIAGTFGLRSHHPQVSPVVHREAFRVGSLDVQRSGPAGLTFLEQTQASSYVGNEDIPSPVTVDHHSATFYIKGAVSRAVRDSNRCATHRIDVAKGHDRGRTITDHKPAVIAIAQNPAEAESDDMAHRTVDSDFLFEIIPVPWSGSNTPEVDGGSAVASGFIHGGLEPFRIVFAIAVDDPKIVRTEPLLRVGLPLPRFALDWEPRRSGRSVFMKGENRDTGKLLDLGSINPSITRIISKRTFEITGLDVP